MKVTIHADGEFTLPDLTRVLLGFPGDRSDVQVRTVGQPGVTVNAERAFVFLRAYQHMREVGLPGPPSQARTIDLSNGHASVPPAPEPEPVVESPPPAEPDPAGPMATSDPDPAPERVEPAGTDAEPAPRRKGGRPRKTTTTAKG